MNSENKNYLTYGSIISFMLDYNDPNDCPTITYDPKNWDGEPPQNKNEDKVEYFTSRNFLYSHGVFNDYCYFYQFKNEQDVQNNYLDTAFIVLPAFEFDSMDALNKMIKKIKYAGISENGVNKQQIIDNYTRFKQEIQTNHDKALKLMKKDNDTVYYNECVQFLHLKSGKFLEYKYNNKNFKTYIQLSNNMSQRTLFRFLQAYDYQAETSTHCLFNLAIRIACGEKNAIKEKFIVNENISGLEGNPLLNKSILEGIVNKSGEDLDVKRESFHIDKKTIFDGEILKKTIKNIFNDENQEPKVIDEFVTYSMNENLPQKNLGVKLMPEENYVVADDTSFRYWRIISFSPDYFEDIKYLNIFDFFCIQNPDKNFFIHLEEIDNEEHNNSLNPDNTQNKIRNTVKNGLFPIKEEKEDLIDNKSEIISEHKSENKSFIIDNKEQKLRLSLNKDLGYVKNKNNISDSTVVFMDNRIEINYFRDSNFNKDKNYKLKVDSYEDKDHLKPFSLFKIEFLLDELQDFDISDNSTNNANIVHEKINVRFVNIFTNKVLYADKIKNNQYKLFLVNDMVKTDKRYANTIFSIQQIKDAQDIDEDELENNSEEENKDDNNENDSDKENDFIKKNSFVKIYNNKFSAYIGIRIRNENNYKELILTNSMSDITKFKFNCLDEEDKYELHFFEQLLLSFSNILKYFENENKTVTIIKQNYERIQHILITLRNKLNQFRKNNNRDVKNLNLQENKFDFIEIIQHFKIVSKLTELFLSNWFRNYHDYSYERLENKIKEYFKDSKDILKYKLIISREILNILSIIYELNPSYLNAIEDSLLYFFMFIGRDDKCTKFLVDILNNNKLLLISLCPLCKDNLEKKEEPIENEENINEINSMSKITDNEEKIKKKNKFKEMKFCNLKKCLKRIIKDYNTMTIDQLRINFSSVVLFFNLMNNLLILDNMPFNQFYNDYFKDLGLLKTFEDNILKPNYEQNPLLIDFYLNGDNELYVRKKAFSTKERNEANRVIDIKINNLIDIISNYNYETEEDRNNIIFAKLVSVNLFFYSFLSLCDPQFKKYMENIFKFDHLLNNYLTFTYNIIDSNPNIDNVYQEDKKYITNNGMKTKKENPLMNDLKCSIIQVLTYLYLKVPSPFIIKTHLFKIINNDKIPETTTVNKEELKKIIYYIDLIINNKEEKLNIKIIDYYCLIEILELIKYTLRNLYLMKNNIDESDREMIYNLIVNVINLLVEFIGLSKKKDDQYNEEKMLNSLNSIINDKLDLINPMFLVSENYQYVFLKYKNKLEEAIKNQNEKGNNIKTFLDILSDICDKDRIQKNKYDFGKAEITKKNIKLLRRFNLKKVLLNVSINSNRNNENIKNFILLIMEEIIQEFLKYLEYSTIEQLGDGINVQNDLLGRKEFEERLKNEVINKKISTKYLDEFKKKITNDDEYPISLYFLKFLLFVDNTKLKYLALEILYKLNNAKKIFYFNMSNLVILETREEYTKFIEVKELFFEIIQTVKNLNLIQRLDNNSIVLCNFLNEKVQILLEKLFDEDKWNEENNALNDDEDIKFEDSIGIQKETEESLLYSIKSSKIDEEEDDKEEDKEEDKEDKKKDSNENRSKQTSSKKLNDDKSQIFSFESKKSEDNINNTSLKNKKLTKAKTKLEGDYFLKDYDYENLIIYQQTLYNLDFIPFLNDFFGYIDKLSEKRTELTGDLFCLEETLISIYKLLVVFITNSDKNQSIIKNRLYLYICPLKIKKISSDLLYSLNYFLFHLVYNFKSKSDYGKISHIDIVTERLYLLHQLDWNLHKNVMPYFVRTLLIFFEFSTPEYIYLIFQLLDDIKNIVTEDIINGNKNANSILILTKLLQFIEIEQQKKEIKEYRNRPLLSMTNIIQTFPVMIKLLTPKTKNDIKNFKFAIPLIYLTNLLFDFFDPYYKNDFEANKTIILDSLLDFCRKVAISNDFLYNKSRNNKLLKNFNEFIGLSLPKLCILLSLVDAPDSSMEEILDKVNQFYEKLYRILEENKEEEIFLEEKHEEEVGKIYEELGGNINYFDEVTNMVFEKSSSNSLMHVKTINKNELKQKYTNLRKASNKRILFDKDFLNKKTLIQEDKEMISKYNSLAEKEIEDEREKFIIKIFNFFNIINENNSDNLKFNISFYINYCNDFSKHFENNLIKNEFFFFYWTSILLMKYNHKKQCFSDEPKYNKDYFIDLSLIEFTIERFENINLNYNNYENLLYIKFLDSYLYKLDESNKAKFLNKLIEKPESVNLFHLMHNILANLFSEIQKNFEDNDDEKDCLINKCPASLYEKNIDEYGIILQFLVNLSDNNEKNKNRMKDYLRLQYNNTKNHNFIIILSKILESFCLKDNNKRFIPKYYHNVIAIIEFITNCCYGPSIDNQDCVVKETDILNFTKTILKYVYYREKKKNDEALYPFDNNIKNNLEENENENENEPNTNRGLVVYTDERRKWAYLKYKLLVLLNVLIIGRKKGDKIYDLIHQVIDFEVLVYVLIETYKEILIENNAMKNPDNFTFEENMLSRMSDLDAYLKNDEKSVGKNFIIFEIGTYAYVLINQFLENLTRPLNQDVFTRILNKKQHLQKSKCEEKSKNIFKNLIDFWYNLVKCHKKIMSMFGKCYVEEKNEDIILNNAFDLAYSFYFEHTPYIEILYNGGIMKYYIRLSPICECLTREMKDEFHSKLDRSSAKTKTEYLFNNVEFYRYQLIMNKKILDAFSKAPILNLFFNHYKFYRDIFLIMSIILNLLIFMSYFKTDLYNGGPQFRYGFLYNNDKKVIKRTERAFFGLTVFQFIIAALILVNYLIFRVSYFLYYKANSEESEEKGEEKDDDEDVKRKRLSNLAKNGEILKYVFERLGNVLLNIIKDIKLIYHLFLFCIIFVALINSNINNFNRPPQYKILSILLIDIIERSSTLMCIVKSFWIPKKQIIVTLVLFYLVAYYFIILIYLFIPDELPNRDCLKFSNCYFTLCDQTIKNSNGIINYLIEDGLYTSSSLWSNPRFWIDNWFAIFDLILVIQMFCGIIIDTFLSQRESDKEIEEDKNNVCFICGLDKNDLNKYYSSENRFNEHIKLDHYLWNYMFAVFNVTSYDKSNFLFLDKIIKEGYEKNINSTWVPYKKCLNQLEKDLNKQENEVQDNENNEDEGED